MHIHYLTLLAILTVSFNRPSGLIAVYDTFGGLQGYLNTFGNIVARNSALSFTYKPPASASSPVEINETLVGLPNAFHHPPL
jgi:hypothetical protein